MTPDLISAEYVQEYKIRLVFQDGATGIVDFKPYIDKGGVYAPLRKLEVFRNFSVDPEVFVLTWPGNVDVAPEELYSKATGTPLPDWMTGSGEYSKAV